MTTTDDAPIGPVPGGRATAFLAAFNDIEQHLRRELKARTNDGFKWMVSRYRSQRGITDTQQEALVAFSDLRNAISHGTYNGGRPIAEPLPETVDQITRLRDLILDPPTALSVLGPQKVRTLVPDEPIHDALQLIRETDISQFPVYEQGRYHALLTTNTIARWVAADLDGDDHLDARTVREVLDYAESSDRAEFLPRGVSAQEAIATLTRPAGRARLPRALILTETGKPHQKPIRVVGGGDLATLVEAIALG